MLGCRQVYPLGVACQGVAAEDVDDSPARYERGQRVPDAAEGPVEGDRPDLVPVLFGDRLDPLTGPEGRVVDEDPKRAVRGDGVEHAAHRRWIGDVGGDGEGLSAISADGRDHRVGLFRAGPGVDGDR